MPLAFFCTLFFRHRKKSVSAPWDGQSLSAPESARQAPSKGNFLRQSCLLLLQAGGFPRGKQSARRALPCVPLVVCLNSGSLTAFGGCIHWIPASLRSPLETFGHRSWRKTHMAASPAPAPQSARQAPRGKGTAPAGAPKGFPRGKQSARFALPCAPLVVCLNSGALTACGGCAHWARASLRSPLEIFGSPPTYISPPMRVASLSPAPESTRQTPPRGFAYSKVVAYSC